jgi:uncharacterized membrane protein
MKNIQRLMPCREEIRFFKAVEEPAATAAARAGFEHGEAFMDAHGGVWVALSGRQCETRCRARAALEAFGPTGIAVPASEALSPEKAEAMRAALSKADKVVTALNLWINNARQYRRVDLDINGQLFKVTASAPYIADSDKWLTSSLLRHKLWDLWYLSQSRIDFWY